MTDHNNQRAHDIFRTTRYATLATVTPDGKPWNSPVAHVLDDERNVYWFSDKQSQHSQNVRASGEVFIVFYDSTVPYGKGKGVFMQAKATELDDPEEIRRARRLKNSSDNGSPEEFMGDGVRRVYKAIPYKAWVNDVLIEDSRFIKDLRVEIPLEAL